jgi:hypothetical protein
MLSSSLLVTPDLESLVRGFAAEVRALVACDGIEFVSAESGITLRFGELRHHSCRYTLKIRDWVAGKMKFTRGRRFTKDELAVLESLLAELLFPLRRALVLKGTTEKSKDREDVSLRHSEQLPRNQESAETSRAVPSAVAPKLPQLSLVPLEAEAERGGGMSALFARESKLNQPRSTTDSPSAPVQQGISFGPDGSLDRKGRALLMESIMRSGIEELQLFKEAREVLGPLVYSDEALVFMSVFSDEALTFPAERSV